MEHFPAREYKITNKITRKSKKKEKRLNNHIRLTFVKRDFIVQKWNSKILVLCNTTAFIDGNGV